MYLCTYHPWHIDNGDNVRVVSLRLGLIKMIRDMILISDSVTLFVDSEGDPGFLLAEEIINKK